MSCELLINVTPMETRVAAVENGVVQDVYLERTQNRGLVGNIYLGKVVRVLPGMQAAFVDIGLERAAFIHASDLSPSRDADKNLPSIQQLVHEGKQLLVQVVKEPISTKGARLTTHLAIPSRYLVFMPKNEHLGVSQRIELEAERDRLKAMVNAIKVELDISGHGYIVRTAAENCSETELRADMNYLKRLWRALQEKMTSFKAPALVYDDLPLYTRATRDLIRADVERIRIDSKETFDKTLEFVRKYTPEVEHLLEYYPGERPIFELFAVEDEIQKALQKRVDLKSGGYLIIEQTEAMTTVDVNTGAFVGHRNLEETIFKTNLEAVTALARQLRLRNLGGIIIIDFIDMVDLEHQRQVIRMLEKMLERDYAKTKVTGVSELGLVEMTRKRTRESLGQMLTEPCSACQGRGRLKTAQTACYEIFREIIRLSRAYDCQGFLVTVAQSVVDRLLDEDSAALADLESFLQKSIKFQVDNLYISEQYDIVLT